MTEYEDSHMTDKQAKTLDILARLDELNQLEELTNDSETLKRIAERKKALRIALESL